jgi:hypothetical protein
VRRFLSQKSMAQEITRASYAEGKKERNAWKGKLNSLPRGLGAVLLPEEGGATLEATSRGGGGGGGQRYFVKDLGGLESYAQLAVAWLRRGPALVFGREHLNYSLEDEEAREDQRSSAGSPTLV